MTSLSNGDFIISGKGESVYSISALISRVTGAGEVIWAKLIEFQSNTNKQAIVSIATTHDDKILFLGIYDYYYIMFGKMSAEGNIEWVKTMQQPLINDFLVLNLLYKGQIQETSSGSILINWYSCDHHILCIETGIVIQTDSNGVGPDQGLQTKHLTV